MVDEWRAFFEIFALLKKEKPAVLHINSSKAGALGALAGRLARVPRIIFTAHGWPFNEPTPASSKLFRWIVSLATLLLSHRVITVSHFDEIHSPLGLKTTTIHNGLLMPEFFTKEKARAYIATRTGIPETACVFGTIAELNKNKGVDILIHAFAKTKDNHLVIVGEGEDRRELEFLIRTLKLESRVHLTGYIDNAARFLKAFDVFVLASRKEGLPFAILEAGAAEVPVIATIVGGIPEIIDDQLSGVLVPAYDVHALTEAMNELATSPGTRARYAERLNEKVKRYFGLRGMVKNTVAVYEDYKIQPH